MFPLGLVVFGCAGKTSQLAETVKGVAIAAHLVVWGLAIAAVTAIGASVLDTFFVSFCKLCTVGVILWSFWLLKNF
jgi:hypothetical protein